MLGIFTKNLQRAIVVFIVMFLIGNNLFSQIRAVRGTVSDKEFGDPLIGVSILVVGQPGVGTVTDLDGKYNLELPEGAKQLQFSYTGFATQLIDITNEVIDVVLSEESEMLNEVVVVGYGTLKTKEVTSAVSTIKSEDFNKGNINDPAQLLQGKIAGLSIAKPGSDPNSGFDIRLRGLSTFGANTAPLIIIDGVSGASLETVDPQDIASVSVLKDASAAAIYGTRAASGVILITTKQGSKDNVGIEYGAYISTEMVARQPDVLSADEFRSISGTTDYGSNTNWFDELSRHALSYAHNLTISGGNDKTNYRISANYRNGQGVVIKTGFDQLNTRVNFSHKAFNDKLKVNINVSNTVRNEELGVSDALGFAIRYNPTAPVREPQSVENEKWGDYFQRDAFGFFNPVSVVEQNTRDKKKKRLLTSIKGNYTLLDGLDFSLFYAQINENDLYGEYYSKKSYWTPFGSKNDKGFAARFTDERLNRLFESTLNYTKDLSGFHLNVLAGYSFQEQVDEKHGLRAGGFLTDGFGYNNIEAADDLKTGKAFVDTYKGKSRIIGFFGRLSLNYQDTYFVTGSLRREGSSKFGANNKWGLFPGISAGINVTKLADIPGIDHLKLRAGYGVTGNTPGSPYLSFLKFAPQIVNGQAVQFFYNGEYINAYGPSQNPNPDIKWEKKQDINIGLDIGLLDYRLNITADYFQSNSTDLLLDFIVRVPPNLIPNKLLNLGEMRNSGLEFSVATSPFKKGDLSWSPKFTFTKYIETTLVKITSPEVENEGFRELGDMGAPFLTGVKTIRAEEGKAIGQIVVPVYQGIDEDGNLIYKDVNGSGSFEAKDDVEAVGNGLPDFQFGFNNSFSYKNFDFSFFFRGVFGHDLLNVSNARYGVPKVLAIQSGMRQILDFANAQSADPQPSSLHVENASYVKLDNISLGYSIPLEGKYFKKLRWYLTGQNLFTITNYSGVDPEVRYTDGGNPLAPGLDRENTYYATKGFSFGLNVSF